MPELPEVEILVRNLRPLLHRQTIREVQVRRAAVLAPTSVAQLETALVGATFQEITRRGKFLRFELRAKNSRLPLVVLGHLGMTGRMFLARKNAPLPKHTAVVFQLGSRNFVYEDTRYFGRLTLHTSALAELGPDPWDETFTPAHFASALKKSSQPIKVKLLDQSLIAGVGNIYASEALFQARISPRRATNQLSRQQVNKLWQAIRAVLGQAIAFGSTIPLHFGSGKSNGLFYYGSSTGAADTFTERLNVYDRAGKPCVVCSTPIRRLVQAARSTFYCPKCQKC